MNGGPATCSCPVSQESQDTPHRRPWGPPARGRGPGFLGPLPRGAGALVARGRGFPIHVRFLPDGDGPGLPLGCTRCCLWGCGFFAQVHPARQSRRERHRCALCECDPDYVSAPAAAPRGRPPVRGACFRGRRPRLQAEPRGTRLKAATRGAGTAGPGYAPVVSETGGPGWTGAKQQRQLPAASLSGGSGSLWGGSLARTRHSTSLARPPGREGTDGTLHRSGTPAPTSRKSVCSRKGWVRVGPPYV